MSALWRFYPAGAGTHRRMFVGFEGCAGLSPLGTQVKVDRENAGGLSPLAREHLRPNHR